MSRKLLLTPQLSKALASVKSAVDAGKLPASLLGAELGISGTTIWSGDVQSEANTELIHQAAYGRAGSRAWGEWEKLLRTDEAVSKAVEFTKAQIRDARVDVKEASEDSGVPEAARKQHADFVRWNLLEALEPGWAEVSQQMTGGSLVNGFALHEIVMAPCRHRLLPGGSGYRVAKLAERLPSSVHINGWVEGEVPLTDVDGAPLGLTGVDLVAVKQWGPRAGRWVQTEIPAEKLLLTTWNRSGSNYLGFSAFRSVWYICKIREHLLKVLAIGAVRESAGIPIATMDREVKLTPKARQRLQRFLANIVYHENASAVLPPGVNLSFLFSPAANKGHVLDAWKELGTHVLGQLQAQQMALGLSNTGSRSVGQIHDQVADAFARGVIANITGVLNGTGARPYTGLVRKSIDVNFGPQLAYPVITMTPRRAKLQTDLLATAVKTMKDGGLITVWSHDDENNMREEAALRLVTPEEFEAAEQKKADQQQAMFEQQQRLGGEPDDDEPKPKPGFPPKDAARRKGRGSSWTPRRPLRASEAHLDLPGMVDFLDGGKERFERLVKPLVVEMLTRALPDVRTAMKDGRIDSGELASVKLDTSRLEPVIGKFLESCRAEGYRHVAGELARSRKQHGASEEDDVPPPSATPPDNQTEQLLAAERKRLARKMASRLADALETTAIDVLRTGGAPEEVVSDVVADQVESKSLQADAGGVMTRAFNMGREQFAEEHGDEVESAELSAVMDDNTCDYCDSMDGTELEFGSEQDDALTPPLRQCEGRGRCRCVKVFNFKKPGFEPVDE